MIENKYIRSLDGLRAIAVLLVIFRHWHMDHLNLEFGWIGVSLFFVLSGFLITSILLKDKTKSLGSYLKLFYIKRSLRIFPIYYLYLIACVIFFGWAINQSIGRLESIQNGYSIIRDSFLSLFTYTYNFHNITAYMNHTHEVGSKFFGHLWSLCIEEQFYIFFPLVVYFLNRKALKIFLILVIVCSPIARLLFGEYMLHNYGDPFQLGLVIYKTSFFQMDGLALGALLALIGWDKISWPSWKLWLSICFLFVFNLSTVFFLRLYGADVSWGSLGFDLAPNQMMYDTQIMFLDLKYAFTYTILNFIFVMIIILSLRNTIFSKFLGIRPLVWIGKISYGIYLFHNPLFELFLIGLAWFGMKTSGLDTFTELCCFVVYLILILLISFISFRFVESPFLRIKDRLKQTN